jgi:hypothetical protein
MFSPVAEWFSLVAGNQITEAELTGRFDSLIALNLSRNDLATFNLNAELPVLKKLDLVCNALQPL